MLTGGGDCPGLNAVIRAICRKGINAHGHEFVGFRYGWAGVLAGAPTLSIRSGLGEAGLPTGIQFNGAPRMDGAVIDDVPLPLTAPLASTANGAAVSRVTVVVWAAARYFLVRDGALIAGRHRIAAVHGVVIAVAALLAGPLSRGDRLSDIVTGRTPLLAGATRAVLGHLARLDGEREVVDRLDGPEVLAEARHLDRMCHRWENLA